MRITRSNEDPSRGGRSVLREAFAFAMCILGAFAGSLQENGQPIRGQERVRLRVMRVVVLFAADEAAVPGQQMREDHRLQAAAELIVGPWPEAVAAGSRGLPGPSGRRPEYLASQDLSKTVRRGQAAVNGKPAVSVSDGKLV